MPLKQLAFAFAAAAALLTASPSQAQPAKPALRVVLIDVEGGASTLYVTPEGKSLLIDAGWPEGQRAGAGGDSADRVVAALRKAGLNKLDVLVVSHYHSDHAGAVPKLLRTIPVGLVVDHGENFETIPRGDGYISPRLIKEYLDAAREAGVKRKIIKPGDRMRVGSMRIDFVNAHKFVTPRALTKAAAPAGCDEMPERPPIQEDENDYAIGVVATYGKARILNLADTTWFIEKRLLCPANRIGPIDLMVVSHHGASASNSPQLYDATRPRVALVGNGATKGGDKIVFQTLAAAPSQPEVWQLHSATRSPEVDAPADRIANLAGAPDMANPLEAMVFRDGAIRVENGRNGFARDYAAP